MIDISPLHTDCCFRLVDLQLINFPDDFIYSLHSDDPVDVLEFENLNKFGQLYPLLVQQKAESQYHLLACYPYFTALKATGMKKVVCQILSPSLPLATVFSLQILRDLSSPQSSPIAQAHLLRKAQKALSEEELLSLLSLMGHKSQRYKLKELFDLLQLDPSAILALHRGIISGKTAKKLSLLCQEDQRSLTNLITTYRIGGSKQQKLIEMMTELVLRDQVTVVDIVNKWLPDQETTLENRPQRLQGLLQTLYEQCYPDKMVAEKKFRNLMQELQPPDRLIVEHCLSFENEEIEVRLKFNNSNKLKEKWGEIKRIIQ